MIEWERGIGRPQALRLSEAVAAVCMYLRDNVTEDVVAEVFGCSQPVVSQAITTLEGLIADVSAEFVPDPAEAVKSGTLPVDGTLAPCWSWCDHRGAVLRQAQDDRPQPAGDHGSERRDQAYLRPDAGLLA